LSVYRNILKHSSLYALVIIASRLSSVLLLPVYTRHLSPGDYGLLELLELTSFAFTSLIGAQLSRALLYYYFQAGDDPSRDTVVTTAWAGATLLGVAGAGIAWASAERLSALVFQTTEYASYFRLSLSALMFTLPQETAFSYLRAANRSQAFVVGQLGRLALNIALSIYFLTVAHLGAVSILWSNLVSSLATVIALSLYCLRPMRFSFNIGTFWQLARYGAPLGVGGLGTLFIHFGDRFFLNRNSSLDDVGVYSLAYKFGMMVSYLQIPFNTYWTAQMFDVAKRPGGDQVYARVGTYYMVAVIGISVVLSVTALPVIQVLTTPAFYRAAELVPLLVAAYVVRSLGDYFRNAMLIENKSAGSARITVAGALIALAAYWFLIPRFRLWGAASATALTYVAMAWLSYIGAQRIRAYPFETGRLWRLGLCGGTAIALPLIGNPQSLAASVVWALASSTTFILLLWGCRFFDADEIRSMRRLAIEARERLTAAFSN